MGGYSGHRITFLLLGGANATLSAVVGVVVMMKLSKAFRTSSAYNAQSLQNAAIMGNSAMKLRAPSVIFILEL